MTIIILFTYLFISGIGYFTIYQKLQRDSVNIEFARDYRHRLISLANRFFQTYDRYDRTGSVDSELYIWLVKNVDKMQFNLGGVGIIQYVAPYRAYHVPRYQVIINTLPKFRDGTVKDFDVDSCDDCLLRYIGITEGVISLGRKNLRNPLIWFREGFQQLMSLPFHILNWFNILSDNSFSNLTNSFLFKLLSGIAGLITLASGIVTIIVGKDQTLVYFKHLFRK